MTARRELVVAVGLCGIGAAVVLLALARPWLTYRYGTAPLPARHVTVTGNRLAGGARVLGLVGLAGIAALPATRRSGRVIVGLLLASAGVAIVAVVVRVLADPDGAIRRSGPFVDLHVAPGADLGRWPYAAVAGGVVLAAAGLLVIVRGRRWAELSARYDAPAGAAARQPSMWDALDRGEDPTAVPPTGAD